MGYWKTASDSWMSARGDLPRPCIQSMKPICLIGAPPIWRLLRQNSPRPTSLSLSLSPRLSISGRFSFYRKPSTLGRHLTLMASGKQRAWGYAAAKPTMDDLVASRERIIRVSADFLKIDLQTALTFVNTARQTNDDFRKRRNCLAARKAYVTVMNLAHKVNISTEDDQVVRRGLIRLKRELESLGETF
jgi:hypothetical protein